MTTNYQTKKTARGVNNYLRAARLIYNNYGLNKDIYHFELRTKLLAAGFNHRIIKHFYDSGVLHRKQRGVYIMTEFNKDTHIKVFNAYRKYFGITDKVVRVKRKYTCKNKENQLSIDLPPIKETTEQSFGVQPEPKVKRTRIYKKPTLWKRLQKAWRVLVR